MSVLLKPKVVPGNNNFSSGPCAKRPGWSSEALSGALVGRSHRAKPAKAKIQEVSDRSRKILGIPDDYLVGIVPASDTGAVEMALWSLLGCRPVDILAWESFGEGWVTDLTKQLKLENVRTIRAPYGDLPDLSKVNFDNDVVFTWNGTTSGVCVPDGDWIPETRSGLTICDATSAVFAMNLPWKKLDVVTYSWQKVLGGEAQHGVLVLSPEAVSRLESFAPDWPLPKIFRLTKKGKINRDIFSGATINTVSLLCVEDALDALKWADGIGGLNTLVARSQSNLSVISNWIAESNWASFLANKREHRSSTAICIQIVANWVRELPESEQTAVAKNIVLLLDDECVAYDIGSYRDAPPGLRIWGGATVETEDLKALCPWLDWAYNQVMQKYIG